MKTTVLLVAINSGLSIEGTPPSITLGVPYTTTLKAHGASGKYTFSENGSLPTGIHFTDHGDGTATIAGTTPAAGSYPISVTLTVTGGATPAAITYQYVLVVPNITANLIQKRITRGVALSPGDCYIAATGGAGSYTYSASGLPAGLTLNTSTGAIAGTVTAAAGDYTVSFTVTDFALNTATGSVKLKVLSRLTLLTPNPLYGAAETNCSSNYTLQVAGATGTVTFTPATGGGLSLSAAGVITASTINFTHPAAGTATLVTTATDSGTGDTLPIALSVDVKARPTATNAAKGVVATYPNFWPPQYVGIPYYIPPPVVTGGTPPYTFVDLAGNLSVFGLTLNPETGAISGTATSLNAVANGYQSGVVIGVGIRDALFPFSSGNGSISGNLAQFLPNNAIQAQKNASNVGSVGPQTFNFAFTGTGAGDVSASGSTVTVNVPARYTTTTAATFVVAAVNSTQVVNVASSNGYVLGDFCAITDGSHTITGQVTAVGSATQLTVKTLVISAGAAGNTMATAATVTPAAMPKATSSIDGYLSAADFTTFNAKLSSFANQSPNVVFAGPVSGGAAAPAFRALVAADIPSSVGSPVVTTASTNVTLSRAVRNIVAVTAAGLTITLPAAPSVGDEVDLLCVAGVTSLTVDPNSLKIMANVGTLTCDLFKPNGSVINFDLIYSGASDGWLFS